MIEQVRSKEEQNSEYQLQCPLCSSFDLINHLIDLDVQSLISRWRDTYKIDISKEFGDWQTIALNRCCNCKLLFFDPLIAGSDRFYTELQRQEWYYMAEKWEFQTALQDLRPGSRCLEIGCGTGSFIRMAVQHGIDIEGIELNDAAVQEALDHHLPVSNKHIADLVGDNSSKYNALCAFQVLEHVAELRLFLDSCIRLLSDGGFLIFSVPNEGGFLNLDADNLLNQPPHHVSRWTRQALSNLQSIYPLKLIRIAYEPLATYHLDWYISLQQGRFPDNTRIGELLRNALGGVFEYILIPTSMYRLLRGHTMYACFQKITH